MGISWQLVFWLDHSQRHPLFSKAYRRLWRKIGISWSFPTTCTDNCWCQLAFGLMSRHNRRNVGWYLGEVYSISVSLWKALNLPKGIAFLSMAYMGPRRTVKSNVFWLYLFRDGMPSLSSSYNISGLVPACWLFFQCFVLKPVKLPKSWYIWTSPGVFLRDEQWKWTKTYKITYI